MILVIARYNNVGTFCPNTVHRKNCKNKLNKTDINVLLVMSHNT